ncbi:hypothetical protein [Chromobacterium haemolyticum]|uniref:hypothetical protein n=1 Tax=Chromobacterium haemolyticum TaxID=394935 RepID=UPI0009DB5CF2|nr:hypothetical protein [Chromobacterium haemolyticum]OQS44863.1 hypothetical protein B0T39_01045 [Chromobacterium haemolyticum]
MIEYDFKSEIIKISPAAGVATTTIMGIPLQDWVYIVTIFYLILQVVALGFKIHDGNKKKGSEANDRSKDA